MVNSQGFWSYVHADDEAEGWRISRLATDLKSQFQMLTGENISLFLDKVSIAWGEKWRDKIDTNLGLVAFFIPVMTPRYFMSVECRRELQDFAQHAIRVGIKELIMPLYYLDVSAIEERTKGDALIELVCTFQWEDWRNLRFLETSSEGYRKGVANLAKKLYDANRRIEERAPINMAPEIVEVDIKEIESLTVPIEAAEVKEGILNIEEIPMAQTEVGVENNNELPGTLDKLATSEEMLNKMPVILNSLTEELKIIASILQHSTEDINKADSQNKGFAARLIISREMASELEKPIENIWLLSNEFVSGLHSVDEGYRIIIERAPLEIKDHPENKATFCELFQSIRNLSVVSQNSSESMQKMINASEPLANLSRDLRPVMRRLTQGLTIMVESREITNEWVNLIDATGIICEDSDTK